MIHPEAISILIVPRKREVLTERLLSPQRPRKRSHDAHGMPTSKRVELVPVIRREQLVARAWVLMSQD